MTDSKLFDSILETAKDLELDVVTMREIELIDFNEVKVLSSRQIKKIRNNAKLSQGLLAKILNVTPSTYQKWERGEVTPKGANLKLLRLAYEHGVGYIL